MLLRHIRLSAYRLAFRRPFLTAHEVWTHREGFLLEIEDDAGHIGHGEAAPLRGFGTESADECRTALCDLSRTLPGRRVDEAGLTGSGAMAADADAALEPDIGAAVGAALPVGLPAVRHALETALLELVALRRGCSLARLLSPIPAQAVEVNATLGATAPDEAAKQARAALADGFATLKVKGGTGTVADDVARLRAVRLAVGPGPRLRLDANGAWSLRAARRALQALAPLELEFVEQPLAPGQIVAMARLRRDSPIPLAADETLSSPERARRVLAAGAADVLVLKPMVLGGLRPALALAREARAQGIGALLTTALDAAYGRAAALHAAAALAGSASRPPVPACGLATGALLRDDLVPAPPQPRQGRMEVPAGPGLGLPEPDVRRLRAVSA